jgi:hypothetical protein
MYFLVLLLVIIGLIIGAGHTPKHFEFLSYVITAPCYLLDLVIPHVPGGMLVTLSVCLVAGVLAYTFLGILLDLGLAKYRASRNLKREQERPNSLK